MSQKNNVVLIIILLVFLGLYFFVRQSVSKEKSKRNFVDLQDRERVQIIFSKNEDAQVKQDNTQLDSSPILVEVVNTAESTTQGLSGRTEIGAEGMLFIFPQKQVRYFWMKDMRFDIDIVWIMDKKVVGISEVVPKPETQTPDNRLETYPSPQEVDVVLELRAGDAQKYDINPGDVVHLVE